MPYTNIDDPSAYFQAETYTGAGANTSVTFSGNSDLKPDFLWIKNRTAGYAHAAFDSNRNLGSAVNAPFLEPNDTSTENSNQNWWNATNNGINTDGFQFGSVSEHNLNNLGSEYVAWAWKANGGTTVSNTDGDITTTVQANTDAGFSIVTYAGNSTNDTKIGHGLGVTLDMMLVKVRDTLGNWQIFHKDLNLASPEDYRLRLNLTDANQYVSNIWGITTRTSTTIAVKSFAETNLSGSNYVAYCFASKQGYSKFGSYVGNGNADGPFVYTGFKPAFVIVKPSSGTGSWLIHDSSRDPANVSNLELQADTTTAEYNTSSLGAGDRLDFLSNGFKNRTANAGMNGSGVTFIYMAFAENPFVTSTGIPTTAR